MEFVIDQAFSYNLRVIEASETISICGLRCSSFASVWKLFSQFGVDNKKVKHLQFVSVDIIEIILFESYIDEFTKILEDACKKLFFVGI